MAASVPGDRPSKGMVDGREVNLTQLARWMLVRHVSTARMAASTGIPFQTIKAYRAGRRRPTYEVCILIGRVLRLAPQRVWAGTR